MQKTSVPAPLQGANVGSPLTSLKEARGGQLADQVLLAPVWQKRGKELCHEQLSPS